MSKGFSGSKGGISYNVGGTKIFNYADAMQYYGLSGDGVDRYKLVYEQVGVYLNELNPNDYKNSNPRDVAYENIMNLNILRSLQDLDSGVTEVKDYDKINANVMASGNWSINFNTGSDKILPNSYETLNKLYSLIIQAEDTKVSIQGHTDNTGDYELNKRLSEARANAVLDYLVSKGMPYKRAQEIVGRGSDDPIADNNTSSGRDKNRRVQVILLN